MRSIFYDLETSDKDPIGQILNFSFIAVDRNWKIISELSDNIRISRLQLPVIDAILANRTDVLEHQKKAALNEKEAMLRIHGYLKREIAKTGGGYLPLIGYNSARFDLPYLRTSFIRNGISPYFGGKLINRDLLFASRKLACTCREFPRFPDAEAADDRLSLKLENLCRRLGLLQGKQTHKSRDDVLLTIKYAKTLVDDFNLDVRTYEAYEPARFTQRGTVTTRLIPEYDLSSKDIALSTAVMLLDSDHRYALWVDLDQFRKGEGENSVHLFKKAGGAFIESTVEVSAEDLQLAKKALKKLDKINLRNFFSISSCDIEQDIYRLDFDAIDALEKALYRHNRADLEKLKGRDAKVVFLRNQMAEYSWGTGQDKRMETMLKRYALYRYGGKAKMNKFDARPGEQDRYHRTFAEMMAEIERISEQGNKKDAKLARSLRDFYLKSDIYRIAGPELEENSAPSSAAA